MILKMWNIYEMWFGKIVLAGTESERPPTCLCESWSFRCQVSLSYFSAWFVIIHFGFRWLLLKHHRTLLAILGKGWYSHKIDLDFVEILEITFVPWAKEEEKCPPVVRESSEQIISLEGTEHRFPPPSPHQGAHIKYKHISTQIQIQNYIYLQICEYSSLHFAVCS